MSLEKTKKVFEKTFCEYGLPLVIRTDNGTPFSSTNRYGISRLSVWWMRLGIHPERIVPGHPEQNGRHERMHRTLKQDVANPPARNIRIQQRKFNEFSQIYNYERPHEALMMKTPSSCYIPSNRSYQSSLPEIEYAANLKVHKVQIHGEITVKGRYLFISECLSKQPLGIEQISDGQSIIWYCNYQLGVLDHENWIIRPIPCLPLSKVFSRDKEL